jgi:hypothetical protein
VKKAVGLAGEEELVVGGVERGAAGLAGRIQPAGVQRVGGDGQAAVDGAVEGLPRHGIPAGRIERSAATTACRVDGGSGEGGDDEQAEADAEHGAL